MIKDGPHFYSLTCKRVVFLQKYLFFIPVSTLFQQGLLDSTKSICSDLLKHDLIALLDVVLPDGVCQLRAVVYEVVGPQHVHRGHVARLRELGRQERELEQHNNVNTLQLLLKIHDSKMRGT
jgi:hypothetical protein